jgi:membrane-associated phospholipid phosphatase
MNHLIQAIHSVDADVYCALGRFAGNPFFDRLVSHEESNNLLKGGLFFAAFWYLWLRMDAKQDERRRNIVAILIGAVLAILAARTVALIAPFRMRPLYDPIFPHFSYSIPIGMNLENWSSFPSDTAAYFFALAFGIAYHVRRLAIPVMLFTAGWICLPRMYLGIHYASDIVVGGAIGISVAWLSLRSDLLRSRVAGRVLSAMDTKPEWFYPLAFLLSFEMATVFAGLRDAGRAGLNAALLALQVPHRHAGAGRPIDEWGGLLVMIGLVGVSYLTLALYRNLHADRQLGVNAAQEYAASRDKP